jgi:hypothetical protein
VRVPVGTRVVAMGTSPVTARMEAQAGKAKGGRGAESGLGEEEGGKGGGDEDEVRSIRPRPVFAVIAFS